MRSITATEFKNRAAEILKEVAISGETVLVTKRGKPLVRVEPAAERPKRIVLGGLQGTVKFLGDVVGPVFDEWETVEPVSARGRSRR